jgi:hypothetical protein
MSVCLIHAAAEADEFMPFFQQLRDDLGPDEAIGASNENAHELPACCGRTGEAKGWSSEVFH